MKTSKHFSFQSPSKGDGYHVHKLIQNCPPLDTNSMYCNLLQCHHFAETSVLAKQDDEVAGFVSGYIIPGKANTLFVWQVAVDASFRGNGLAQRMIEQILSRECCQSVEFIETTITESNKPSWALFKRLAEKHSVSLTSETLFDKEQDFKDQHDSELLVKIGPFSRPSL